MRPIITAFRDSPDKGRGLARDMQVRWALEEVGQPYDVRLLPFAEMKEPAHLALQPFGKNPTYEEGEVVLFESGAIVLHIALCHAGLLPEAAGERAKAMAWMFSAQSTIEPLIVECETARFMERDRDWFAERLALAQSRVHRRLAMLADHVGERAWLDGDFSAGDLLMIGVLRRLGGPTLLQDFPNLAAYVARGEARDAFQRAFAAQLAVYQAASAR